MYKCLQLVDSVVICPYDNNHLIAQSRLQRHIVKCEKKYPENYKLMCPYDATHRLFKHELEEHIITCPMRMVLETDMYSEPRKHGATNFPAPSDISSTIDCDENWDLDIEERSTVFTAENDSSVTDAGPLRQNISAIKEANVVESVKLRAPRGFSEAMLREVSEDSCVEDVESIISSMGFGRGRVTSKSNKLKIVGLGRGESLNNNL